jgi:hypothetical protein
MSALDGSHRYIPPQSPTFAPRLRPVWVRVASNSLDDSAPLGRALRFGSPDRGMRVTDRLGADRRRVRGRPHIGDASLQERRYVVAGVESNTAALGGEYLQS